MEVTDARKAGRPRPSSVVSRDGFSNSNEAEESEDDRGESDVGDAPEDVRGESDVGDAPEDVRVPASLFDDLRFCL